MGFAFCATASDCWDESPETAICWWIAVTCLCVGTVIIFLVMSTHRSFELANQAPQIPAAVPVHRTEDNFILGNMSHKLSVPPPYTAEVNIVPNNRLELWKYMHRPFARIAACATGVGLISGSFQVFWWLLARYAVFTDDSRIQNQIRGVQVSVTEVIDAFKFFPILLTVTYLGYRVTKYRCASVYIRATFCIVYSLDHNYSQFMFVFCLWVGLVCCVENGWSKCTPSRPICTV